MDKYAEQILGPVGALVLALFVIAIGFRIADAVIRILWAEHQRSDLEDRSERDRLLAVVESMVPDIKKLAEAQLKQARDAEKRQRRGDP